jgi:hypothetical protein
MIFLLQFAQCVFQIIIPMPAKDLVTGEERSFDLEYYPTLWENKQYVDLYGRPHFFVSDLSEFDLVRNETVDVQVRYDSIIRVVVSPEADATRETRRRQTTR